jgi:hypothetical protein
MRRPTLLPLSRMQEMRLCVMNWMYGLDTLDFDHNLIPLPADQRDNPSQAFRRHKLRASQPD